MQGAGPPQDAGSRADRVGIVSPVIKRVEHCSVPRPHGTDSTEIFEDRIPRIHREVQDGRMLAYVFQESAEHGFVGCLTLYDDPVERLLYRRDEPQIRDQVESARLAHQLQGREPTSDMPFDETTVRGKKSTTC